MSPVTREDIASILQAPIPWDQFRGTTVLVTGASGILGTYMVETLLELNRTVLSSPARIVALVRNPITAKERFSEHMARPDFHLLIQDVCVPLPAAERPDYVLHAASQVNPGLQRDDPVGTLLPNAVGTSQLLRAVEKHSIRGFLFLSSGTVYGTNNFQTSFSESDLGYLDLSNARASYAESKRMGEMMCVAWARQFGVPTRIVRPFHTYGPGMPLDDGRLCADFVRDILRKRPLVFHNTSSAPLSFCYLADATAAFFTVLLKGGDGEAYNVANPDASYSVRQLAGRLTQAFDLGSSSGNLFCRANEIGSPETSGPAPSIEKISSLGWKPRTDVEEGFRRTVRSYSSGSNSTAERLAD